MAALVSRATAAVPIQPCAAGLALPAAALLLETALLLGQQLQPGELDAAASAGPLAGDQSGGDAREVLVEHGGDL